MTRLESLAHYWCSTWLVLASFFLSIPGFSRPICDSAQNDSNVFWGGLYHDTFDLNYRTPFGAVPDNANQVNLRIRTCANDVESIRVRVWDDFLNRETWLKMNIDKREVDAELGNIEYYTVGVPIPRYPTVLYYLFEIRDGSDIDYYVDDDIKKFGGGTGAAIDVYDDKKSFQITVYDSRFNVASWLQGAVIYHIFPDRFFNGDPSNDPVTGGDWIYGKNAKKLAWDEELCDPRGNQCPEEYQNQFYGGDLEGVYQKLDYLQSLGITVIYLNPIAEAPSNHLYDVQDHKKVDSYFGDMDTFIRLSDAAKQKGIRIILDGSFNHTSSDSPFFDYFSRWNKSGQLVNAFGPGFDDGSGACESPASPYRDWYFLPDIGSPAVSDDRQTLSLCPRSGVNEPSENITTYEGWFQFNTLPKLQIKNPSVRNYLFASDSDAVAPFWLKKGASGWRLDVAGDVDPGATVDPHNTFWEGFRNSLLQVKDDAVMIGEEWGDASPLLLGREMDTVMNYRFRSALLDWMFDRCSGKGCYGTQFEDNDSKPYAHPGAISPMSESQLELRLKSIQEDYPRMSWMSAANLLGSHDTNRIRFLLQKISSDQKDIALKKYKFLTAFQFLYPGSASVYYGDEVAVDCPGKWDGSQWQDDPYNRCTHPWDEGQMPSYADEVLQLHKTLGALRRDYETLRQGNYQTLYTSDENRIFAFSRQLNGQSILAIFNRNDREADIVLPLDKITSSESFATDLIDGQRIPIENNSIKLKAISGLGFKVLLLNN